MWFFKKKKVSDPTPTQDQAPVSVPSPVKVTLYPDPEIIDVATGLRPVDPDVNDRAADAANDALVASLYGALNALTVPETAVPSAAEAISAAEEATGVVFTAAEVLTHRVLPVRPDTGELGRMLDSWRWFSRRTTSAFRRFYQDLETGRGAFGTRVRVTVVGVTAEHGPVIVTSKVGVARRVKFTVDADTTVSTTVPVQYRDGQHWFDVAVDYPAVSATFVEDPSYGAEYRLVPAVVSQVMSGHALVRPALTPGDANSWNVSKELGLRMLAAQQQAAVGR